MNQMWSSVGVPQVLLRFISCTFAHVHNTRRLPEEGQVAVNIIMYTQAALNKGFTQAALNKGYTQAALNKGLWLFADVYDHMKRHK